MLPRISSVSPNLDSPPKVCPIFPFGDPIIVLCFLIEVEWRYWGKLGFPGELTELIDSIVLFMVSVNPAPPRFVLAIYPVYCLPIILMFWFLLLLVSCWCHNWVKSWDIRLWLIIEGPPSKLSESFTLMCRLAFDAVCSMDCLWSPPGFSEWCFICSEK